MQSIDAGRLNKLAEIQADTEAADGRGGVTSAWSRFAEVWCEFKTLSSEDVFAARALAAGAELRLSTRYIPGVTTAMRVVKSDDSRTFEIVGVVNVDEAGEVMHLHVREDRRDA